MAQDIYDDVLSRYARRFSPALREKVVRLFDQINAVTQVETLAIPPGNRLEKLKGNLQGSWSVRVNKQWRIVFRWDAGDACDVDIVDYH